MVKIKNIYTNNYLFCIETNPLSNTDSVIDETISLIVFDCFGSEVDSVDT